MIEAKYTEIRDLVNRTTFRAVLRTELPDGANLVSERYVFAIKSDKNKEEQYKARSVAGGYLHIMKDYLVHCAQTIQCVSVHIILVDAKFKGFHLWVVDVHFEYLQSDKPLIRKIFVTSRAPELELSSAKFLEFLSQSMDKLTQEINGVEL